MRITSAIPAVLAASCVLAACHRQSSSPEQPIPLVDSLIADDGESGPAAWLKGYAAARENSIFIVGEPGECDLLGEELLSCDDCDNASGAVAADGLPDFSGETICSIADSADAPYSRFFADTDRVTFREQTVLKVLASLDTLCYASPYDKRGEATKRLPKIIVLASPYASEFGFFDADTLLKAKSCGVFVVNPLRLIAGELTSEGRRNIGVISSAEKIATGIYGTAFSRTAIRLGIKGVECTAFARDTAGNVLTSFLDSYKSEGSGKALDALVVDDYLELPSNVDSTLMKIRSVMDEEHLLYSEYLSPDFKVISTRDVTSRECRRILRTGNLFTHNISYPKSEKYTFCPDSTASSGWKLIQGRSDKEE